MFCDVKECSVIKKRMPDDRSFFSFFSKLHMCMSDVFLNFMSSAVQQQEKK